jgi:hypothetical protein
MEVKVRNLERLGAAAYPSGLALCGRPSRLDGLGSFGYLFQSRVGGLGDPWCVESRRPAAECVLAGEVKQVASGAAKFDANLVTPQLALPKSDEVFQVDWGAVHAIHP